MGSLTLSRFFVAAYWFRPLSFPLLRCTFTYSAKQALAGPINEDPIRAKTA